VQVTGKRAVEKRDLFCKRNGSKDVAGGEDHQPIKQNQEINFLIYARYLEASGWFCIIYLILLTSLSDFGFFAKNILTCLKINYDSPACIDKFVW
jgi:hypothetical protein